MIIKFKPIKDNTLKECVKNYGKMSTSKIIQHYPKHLSWIGLRPFKLIPFSYKPETDDEFRERIKQSLPAPN